MASDVEDLKTALRVAGIDLHGLDLAWMATLKRNTEDRIARARDDAAFATARPLFAPQTGCKDEAPS
mgnify:CR=1 FL=1